MWNWDRQLSVAWVQLSIQLLGACWTEFRERRRSQFQPRGATLPKKLECLQPVGWTVPTASVHVVVGTAQWF
jgi:hypothetical protein